MKILAAIAVLAVWAYLFSVGLHSLPSEPDGSAPMPAAHRLLRDPQGHLAGDYTVDDFCHGHVAEIIQQPSSHFTIVCRPALLQP